MKKIDYFLLTLIIVIAGIVRLFCISSVPPSLSWDEASVGYDAYSVLTTGKDQWGQFMPVVFKSFGEFKYPVHIYLTSLLIKLFGYSDFAVRSGSAILGVIVIGLLFVVVYKFTNNKIIAFLSALFLSISPWHIQFSRVNWETNNALFFLLLGIIFFIFSLKGSKYWMIVSFLSFGIDLLTYNAAKIFIPLFIFSLILIFWKEIWDNKLISLTSFIVFFAMVLINLVNPDLSGLTRFNQVAFTKDKIETTYLYKITKRQKIGVGELIFRNYISHFSPTFLFISGDSNPRHSIQTMGELYIYDILLLPAGIYFLSKNKNKWAFLLLAWFFIAPIPASIATEAPHASRSMFALGAWQIVSATGLYFVWENIKKTKHKLMLTCFGLLIILFSFLSYLYKYFIKYPILYSDQWQYGYKEVFLNKNYNFDNYKRIIISDQYGQPYVFALYYLKYDPNKFRQTVIYNPQSMWGASTVKSFDKFLFKKVSSGDLDKNTLVFTTNIDKITGVKPAGEIKNLDGSIAFWVYSR